MGRKADAIRVVNAQTGENYTITRETVGANGAIEVTLRHANQPAGQPDMARTYPDTIADAHQEMARYAETAARRLLIAPTK